MLFAKLLTGIAPGFADVRTYWSPEAVERVTGWKPEGMAENGFIHLINSGAVRLDGFRRMHQRKGRALHEALVRHDQRRGRKAAWTPPSGATPIWATSAAADIPRT